MKNPYTMVFGKEPTQCISRIIQTEDVINTFCDDNTIQQMYMIAGIRGCGKTVFMTEISDKIREKSDWIVIELNPEKDLLTAFAAKLCSENVLAQLFKKAKINLSFFGIGLTVENVAPIVDIEVALTKMLTSIRKSKKRVLVTIDEVTSTKEMKEFAAAYQIFIRQNLPVFLLMTGLYENIRELQNQKSLTFLYRAPKIELKPLNIGMIASNYKTVLKISDDDAMDMAKLTKGYPFAFQVLGYCTWEKSGKYLEAIDKYKYYLDEYVYEKIWSEMSNGDKKILYGIAKSKDGKISDVREKLGIGTNEFNPYRKRLITKGVIDGNDRGYVRFTLPLFEKFVIENYME